MAQQEKKHNFKTVKVLKEQTLGIGSYGKVCRAKCDDLLCAAKLIHETLFDPTAQCDIAPQREHRLPIRRFEQECDFLSTLRHPNIVQYLGVHQDPDTRAPVLLMELMDESLTHFLEKSSEVTPYHIQVNLCHDVSLALSFLHSNDIIHRDLSSNNVLLISNVRAKVTDFGMARFTRNVNTHLTITTCPGTDVYMPPEAVDDTAMYTEKIDCFSFGVIVVQTLTHKFPQPGNRREMVQINHPRFPGGTVLANVPEVDRRQNHIREVDPNHPLLPISLDCLKDNSDERPSAQELCYRVATLKQSSRYSTSSQARAHRSEQRMNSTPPVSSQYQSRQQIRDLQQIIESQTSRLRGKDGIIEERERIIAAEQQRNQLLRQQVIEKDQQIREKDLRIQEKESQLGNINQQLKVSEEIIAQFEKRIHELEHQLQVDTRVRQKTPLPPVQDHPRPVSTQHTGRGAQYLPDGDNIPIAKPSTKAGVTGNLSLTWRIAGERAPCVMNRGCDAIACGVVMYCRHFSLKRIYLFNTAEKKWYQLPECQYGNFSMAFVNGMITTIGGGNDMKFYGLPAIGSGSYTNKLISFVEKGSSGKWIEILPPMPTRRRGTVALSTGAYLVVAGGEMEGRANLTTVEILNTETSQWSAVAHLPEPKNVASATISGDSIYIIGGQNRNGKETNTAYTCSLKTLIKSSTEPQCSNTMQQANTVWNGIADCPVMLSTCVTLQGRLLTVGGKALNNAGHHFSCPCVQSQC
jgi:serine/threonine protein kinase